MKSDGFIDSNVLIDVLMATNEDHHTRAVNLLNQASRGTLTLYVSATVLLEASYVLTRRYRIPRTHVAGTFLELLTMTNVKAPEKEVLRTATDLWLRESPLSFADCYHLVLAESLGLDAIYSFDRKMGRYPGVERLEP